MRLVITEKPSVARDLARVLGARAQRDGFLEGEGLRITWCLGHLVELEEPHHYDPGWRVWSLEALPMVPQRFALRVRADAKDRFVAVQRLLRDRAVTEVVNACDAGREGELIFRYVYELAGASQPVRRLWLASLTESAIRDAWNRLRPGQELDRLADAARCRSEADWLVGLNATRAMTCLVRKGGGGGSALSIGRVQTPTLAMIVGRDQEIEAFVPEPFWQVRATFTAEGPGGAPARWVGTFFQPGAPDESDERADRRAEGRAPDQVAPVAERLPTPELAQALALAVDGRPGRLEQSETRRVVDRAPQLYDLTTLQRRANQRYGLSAQRTLEIAQALYERHKVITYPRTDSRHLTPDQVPGLPAIARGLAAMAPYAPHCATILGKFDDGFRPGRRVVDASEVNDHHAILPTGQPAHQLGLSPDEKRVFDLVARRFLAALSDDALFDRTTLVVAVEAPPVQGITDPPRFRARGRACVHEGWRAVDPPGRSKEIELPRLEPGQLATASEPEVVEGSTRPPRPHDDGSILKAMETAGRALDDAALERALRGSGLGTPATRAAILQTLLDRGFVERRGRELRATERGVALIQAVPAPELKSAELTGRWEERLARMERGREQRAAFMTDVVAHVGELIAQLQAAEPPTSPAFAGPPDHVGPPLGPCPRCGEPVVERRPVFGCTGCAFVIFKKMSGREVSRRLATELLTKGRTRVIKGFRSKRTGRDFDAGLTVRDDGSVGLWFPDRDERGGNAELAGAASPRASASRGAPSGPGGAVSPPEPDRAAPPQPARPTVSMPIDEAGPEGMACPRCAQGKVLRGRRAWGCSRYAQGCGWVLAFDAVQSPAEAAERVRRGE